MMNYENFIFDLDGTLIDSTPSHVRAFNFAISMSKISKDIDFNYEEMKGKRTIDVMRELGFGLEEAQRLTKIKQEKYQVKTDTKSSNRLIARWQWYLKYLFPKIFGNINYKVLVIK